MKKGRFEDFKFVTRFKRLNLMAQIALGLSLYIGLNFMAARHYRRWDFSSDMRNSLSPESVAYVKSLEDPVEIFAVVSQGVNDRDSQQIVRDLSSLLRRYEYASSRNAPVKVDFINPHLDNKKAEKLVQRFGSDLEDCVIVSGKNRFKRIPIVDFYGAENGADRRDFNGEQLISSAILNVSYGKEPKIYFLKGHGEMSIKSANSMRGLSEFVQSLRSRNYAVAELDLNESKRIPDDADMIVIAGAQMEFLPKEIDALRKYLLNSNGRLVVFLEMGPLHGLENIFYEWGIMSDDMLVLDSGGDYESASGDMIARNFPQKSHAIVHYLISMDMPVQFGSVRPVRPDMGAPVDEALKLEPIILSSKSSWGEKSYLRGGMQSYNSETDIPGPLPLAMTASRKRGADLGLTIPGGKLAVFGDENFIANKWFNRLGNSKLAINTVDWMFDENNMLNIAPRRLDSYSITLSQSEIYALALRFGALPIAAALAGFIVFLLRRR